MPGTVHSGVLHVIKEHQQVNTEEMRVAAMHHWNPVHTFMFNSRGKLLNANKAAKEASRNSVAGGFLQLCQMPTVPVTVREDCAARSRERSLCTPAAAPSQSYHILHDRWGIFGDVLTSSFCSLQCLIALSLMQLSASLFAVCLAAWVTLLRPTV